MPISILLKCVAILILVQTLPDLVLIPWFAVALDAKFENWNWVAFATTILPDLIRTILGILLWIFSEKASSMLQSRAETDSKIGNLTRSDLLSVGLGLLGIWLFVDTLPEFANGLGIVFNYSGETNSIEEFNVLPYRNIYGQILYIIKAGLGVLLFFKARSIAAFWSKEKE